MFGNKYFKMDFKEFHKGIYLSHFVVVGASYLGMPSERKKKKI